MSINVDDVVHGQVPTNFQSRSGTAGGRLCPNLLPAMPPIFPNSVEPITETKLANKYILLNRLKGSFLRRCIHIESQQEYMCLVKAKDSYQKLLQVYIRLDSHPNVNPVEEVIVGYSQTYIVFKRGYGDLGSYTQNNRKIPEIEGLSLFKQVVSAVAACHHKGIILRELRIHKLVFKDPEKTQVKLETLDNAVVLEGDDDGLENWAGGQFHYVSPELLIFGQNSTYRGRAADCWSLGVILYTMLVGYYPFFDNNKRCTTASRIARGTYNLPQHLSSEAKCLIRRLLEKDPSRRLTAKGALHYLCFAKFPEELSENDEQIVPLQKCGLLVESARFPEKLSKNDEQIVP